MKKSFYKIAEVLDLYRQLSQPNETDIKQVLKLISKEEYANYFFDSLSNPSWVLPLYKAGYFTRVPNPIEIKEGSYQLPAWKAGEYLVKFANENQDIVIDVIKNIKTENSRAQSILIDALFQIPLERISEIIPQIDSWLDGRFSGLLPNKLQRLSSKLIENKRIDEAIDLSKIIITLKFPKNEKGKIDSIHSLHFRSDNYWVSNYCDKEIPKLNLIDPFRVLKIFEEQIEDVISLFKKIKGSETEKDIGYYSRLDISSSSFNRSLDAYNLLVNGLRDSLLALCNSSREKGQEILGIYLSCEHIIFQRVALYVLRKFGSIYPDLINQALLNSDFFKRFEFEAEYKGLLRDHFNIASSDVKEQVISWILSGPDNLEEKAIWVAQRHNRAELTRDDRVEAKDVWILRYLSIIGGELPQEASKKKAELEIKYGVMDITERPLIDMGSWQSAASPIPSEELEKKSFEDLQEFLLSYEPEDTFLDPREPLSQDLKNIVKNDPEKYADFASYLINPEMQFFYISNYLGGISDAISKNNTRINSSILDLCDFLINREEDSSEVLIAKREAADLLNTALQSDDPYLDRKKLDRMRGMLIKLAHHPEPDFEKEKESGFDPYTQSINSLRGIAMHGLMNYSLYVVRQKQQQEEDRKEEKYIEGEVLAVLDEKLDKSKDPSYAVHSVYGAYFTQLYYLDEKWVINNLSKIFPEEYEKTHYWKAAWDAYILCSNLYKSIFTLLISQYRKGIIWFGDPQFKTKYIGSSPDERFAQHIMAAYINDLVNFSYKSEILELFFGKVPDEIRANGIYWLSGVLKSEKPDQDNELWKRMWILWKKRVEDSIKGGIPGPSQEISEYMRWLEYSPIGLDGLFDILNKSIHYLSNDYESQLLVSFAAKESDSNPLQAVTILQGTILNEKEPWWRAEDEKEKKILEVALKSGNPRARKIAIDVINYRGEQSDFRWKDLLSLV